MGHRIARIGLFPLVALLMLLFSSCMEKEGDGGLLVVFSDSSYFKAPGDTSTVDSTWLEAFDQLWLDVNSNYIFIDEKQSAWLAARDQYRPQIFDNLNTREYRNLLANMLAEMEDENLALVDTADNVFSTYNPFREPNWRKGAWDNTVNPLGVTDHDEWGFMTSDSFGYFFFRGFNPDEIDLDEFDAALDSLRQKKGVLIDLRFCGGRANTLTVPLLEESNTSILSEAIIGRFTDEPVTVVQSYTLDEPDQESIVVESAGENPFTGNIALLTGLNTINEGELFATAMDQIPNVILLGDPTAGVGTATDFYVLSPAWTYAIPAIAYVKMNGELLQNGGIVPDEEVEWDNDSFNHGDQVLLDAFVQFSNLIDQGQ